MLRGLIGWRRETGVAKTATSSFQPNDLLPVFEDLHLLLSRLFVPCNSSQRNFDNNIFSKSPGAIVPAAGFAVLRQHILIITQMQKRPQIFAASEDNMGAAAAGPAIWSGHGVELGAHEMLAS